MKSTIPDELIWIAVSRTLLVRQIRQIHLQLSAHIHSLSAAETLLFFSTIHIPVDHSHAGNEKHRYKEKHDHNSLPHREAVIERMRSNNLMSEEATHIADAVADLQGHIKNNSLGRPRDGGTLP